jgi:hypothetical protein
MLCTGARDLSSVGFLPGTLVIEVQRTKADGRVRTRNWTVRGGCWETEDLFARQSARRRAGVGARRRMRRLKRPARRCAASPGLALAAFCSLKELSPVALMILGAVAAPRPSHSVKHVPSPGGHFRHRGRALLPASSERRETAVSQTHDCRPDGRPRTRRRIVRRPAPPPAIAPPAQAETVPRLLHLKAECPRCLAHPAMRVTPAMVAALAATAPTEELATYQCQRRGCGCVYPLTADAYHRASERSATPNRAANS